MTGVQADARIPTRWRPLLEGVEAERALATVHEIADHLTHWRVPSPDATRGFDPSLGEGAAGIALLFHSMGEAGAASELLDHAEAVVAEVALPPGLYGGFSGVAWAGSYIDGVPGEPDDDRYESVDAALLEHLECAPFRDGFDLIGGLAGFGVYALERLRLPGAVGVLDRVLDRLEESGEWTGGGVTWPLPNGLRSTFPGPYNLGVAHGVPGVIGVLAGACRHGTLRPRAELLLRGSVRWLLAQRLPESERGWFAVAVGGETSGAPSRSAWCYGDPGIAVVLLRAADALDDPALRSQALTIARCAARRRPERSGVEDPGLCHGAAGLGHVFNRIFRATGDGLFRDAARFWFDECLGLRTPGSGVGGFRSRHAAAPGEVEWVDDPGLLTGAAGIALALLAASTSVEPVWDRVMLVS